MSTVLVTGGAGFIGSSLVDKLLTKGENVIIFDNFNNYYDPSIKRQNIQNALHQPNCVLYEGDIEKLVDLEQVFSENKIDIVVHLAARAGVRPSLERPIDYTKTNILGTVNILETMKKYAVKQLCMASSSSVYGNCRAKKFSENLKLGRPISPYAATKLSDELITFTYHYLYDIRVQMLRFFTVYGPRQRPDLAINKFVRLICAGQPIDMYGDGSSMRDYTYIDDITDGICQAMAYQRTKYEIFNLGGGSPVTLKQMIETIEETLGKKAIIHQKPMQPGDVDKTVSDISKAKKYIGYTPKVDFKTGMINFVKWAKEYNKDI